MRTFLVALVLLALVGSVRTDLEGSRREAHADAHCARMALSLGHHGLTERERAHLIGLACRQQRDGSWRSARVFSQ